MTEPLTSSTRIPPPTKIQLHPVFQLQDFLSSLEATNTNDNDDDEEHRPMNPPTTTTTTTPMINDELSMTIEERKDQVISVAEFLFGNTMVTAALSLLDHEGSCTKISSPHRSLWLVRGSTDLAYTCFACDETPGLYYCNCRSYLEKNTKKPQGEEGLPELCKHLLAIKLIPALQINVPHLTVSDKEFAKLVLERTWK